MSTGKSRMTAVDFQLEQYPAESILDLLTRILQLHDSEDVVSMLTHVSRAECSMFSHTHSISIYSRKLACGI